VLCWHLHSHGCTSISSWPTPFLTTASGLVKHACHDLLPCSAGIGTEPTKGPPARGLQEHVHDMKARHPAFGPDADDAAQDGAGGSHAAEGSEEEAHAVTNMQS